jgi:hypothetical protein
MSELTRGRVTPGGAVCSQLAVAGVPTSLQVTVASAGRLFPVVPGMFSVVIPGLSRAFLAQYPVFPVHTYIKAICTLNRG